MKSVTFIAFVFALSVAASSGETNSTPVFWPVPERPADVPFACFAVPRVDWIQRFEGNVAKLKDGPYDLVFDGDSITDNWLGTGRDVWKQRYGAMKALNLGIGGDQVQHLLWRVQNGELAGQNPKLIVLLIGVNNIGEEAKEVATGIKLVIGEYEKCCPDSHILLLGLFPSGHEANHSTRTYVSAVNKIISTYDQDKRVTYLDIGSKFLQPDGTLTPDIMPDYLHPTAKGYSIWADAIQPLVDQYCPKQ